MAIALALILNAGILVGAFVVGLAIRRGSRRQCIAICAVGLAVCLAKGLLARRPDIETRLFPWPDYVLFSGWNGALGMLVVGAMAGLVRRKRDWAFLCLAGLVTLGYFGDHLFWVGSSGGDVTALLAERAALTPSGAGRHRLDAAPRGSPLVRQTTAYTCGAAAAASMLRAIGVTTDEWEMASLCLTRRGRGTPDLGIWRGLNVKLRDADSDLRVRIDRLTYQDLLASPMPVILRVRFSLDHAVLAVGAYGDRVVIFDPSAGGSLFTWDEYTLSEMAGWAGYAFVLYRPDGAPMAVDRHEPGFGLLPPWVNHDHRDDARL